MDKEKDDVSLYGTPKEEVGTVNTSRYKTFQDTRNILNE